MEELKNVGAEQSAIENNERLAEKDIKSVEEKSVAVKNIYDALSELFPPLKKAKTSYNQIIKREGIESFLQNLEYANERRFFIEDLKTVRNILNKGGSVYPLILQECNVERSKIDNLRKGKQLKILEEIRDLEKTCYYVNSYFLNSKGADSEAPGHIYVLQSDEGDLYDENSECLSIVDTILKQTWDRWDIKENFGLVVAPDLGQNRELLKNWSSTVSQYYSFLITDYADLSEFDDLDKDNFKTRDYDVLDPHPDGYTGAGNGEERTAITINHSILRKKYEEIGEEEHIIVGNSSALAGKLCKLPIHKAPAGKIQGEIMGSKGVTHKLLKSETELFGGAKEGKDPGWQFIPVSYEWNKPVFLGVSTLFTGETEAYFRLLPIGRLHDWLTKNIMNFLNACTFQTIDSDSEEEIVTAMRKFLDSYTGNGKALRGYDPIKVEQVDATTFTVNINCYPHGLAERFLLDIQGSLTPREE
jgi:hypothetical protein